jgi:hypothetical protein
VRLSERNRTWSTAEPEPAIVIAQSWIDPQEVRLDLVDASAQRYEARLRVRTASALTAVGTLERSGNTYSVRCTGEQ